MCGIIGQINKLDAIDETHFSSLRDTLKHRGPDNFGNAFFDNKKVGLGHRRLAINDLSDQANQPFFNEVGNISLICNGEIYNYQIIKNELQILGHIFKSNSDNEVVLHGYEEWGVKVIDKLKGMFAFAIWDDTKKELFIARDRFGIKPLHYCISDDNFYFASEIKALALNKNIRTKINYAALSQYLSYRYIPSPNTIWEGIHKLPPATYMIINEDGIKTKKKYWQLKVGDDLILEKEFNTNFGEFLEKSVEEHLNSDLPVGLLLSGGLDSTTINYYLNKLGNKTNSYTAKFENLNRSEHKEARITANIFANNHNELNLKLEFDGLIKKLAYYFDEPMGGTSYLPTYLICEKASENIKVLMSGEGGDELLAGYSWIRKKLLGLGGKKSFLRHLFKINKKNFFLKNLFQSRSWTKWNENDIQKMLLKKVETNSFNNLNNLYNPKLNFIKNAQLNDFNFFLNEFNLTRADRASMANSVELRLPFLDHTLWEYVYSKHSDLYFDKKGKKTLINILKKAVPNEIISKPKQGFSFSLDKFIPLSEMLDEIKKSELLLNIFNTKELYKQLKHNKRTQIWSIYILLQWLNVWDKKIKIEY